MQYRKELAKLKGTRNQFIAKICKFAERKKRPRDPESLIIDTVMLYNLKLMGPKEDILTDHVWVDVGFWSQGFNIGDDITFIAGVQEYTKGYEGNNISKMVAKPVYYDYRLVNIGYARKLEGFDC